MSLGTSTPWGSILPTSSLSHCRYDEENCRCHWRSRGQCFWKLPCNMAEYGWTSCGPENSHRILHITLAKHKKIWILWEIVEQWSPSKPGTSYLPGLAVRRYCLKGLLTASRKMNTNFFGLVPRGGSFKAGLR